MDEKNSSPQPKVEYPRGEIVDKEALKALVVGYFGLYRAIAVQVVWSGADFYARIRFDNWPIDLIYISIACVTLIVGWLTYRPAKSIALGLVKGKGWAITSAITVGLTAGCCCLPIGILWLQQQAYYGLRSRGIFIRFLATPKKLIKEIDAL